MASKCWESAGRGHNLLFPSCSYYCRQLTSPRACLSVCVWVCVCVCVCVHVRHRFPLYPHPVVRVCESLLCIWGRFKEHTCTMLTMNFMKGESPKNEFVAKGFYPDSLKKKKKCVSLLLRIFSPAVTILVHSQKLWMTPFIHSADASAAGNLWFYLRAAWTCGWYLTWFGWEKPSFLRVQLICLAQPSRKSTSIL